MCEVINFVLQLHFPTSVSSMRNTHFQKNTLSNERLVYARHTFSKSSVVSSTRDATFFDKLPSRLRETPTLGGKAEPSPAEPSRAEPIRAEQKSTTQNKVASRLRKMLFCSCLHDLSCGHVLNKCVSSTRNNTMFRRNCVSSTRNTYFWARHSRHSHRRHSHKWP